ncbi:MAG: gliding motility-associated C-terminal domain-containing protein [Cyclobacteriaceae bacterium]
MKKHLLFFLVLFLSFFWAKSFHIVGGEIEFITVRPGVYRINLIQYKDEAQTENPGYDPEVEIFFFSNKDNSFVYRITLPQVSIAEVDYTNFECSIEDLSTSRILYSETVELDPEDFSDEEGYYLVWERCCRNEAIDNIVEPGLTGMKYVLEIPPLWKNDRPFVNTSPILNRPLSDYACVNQLYYVDFIGQDVDGDSLVYRLSTPLNSSSQIALPLPTPKPHLEINWEPGFNLNNVVPGPRPLQINTKGFLTVTASTKGLYVFSVIVEEWRDRVKIGEVQRDFQMLVIDGCNPPDPPEVTVKIPDREDFNSEVDTLNYAVADDKCFEFIVANITLGENISFRAEPVNFEDINGIVEDVFSVESRNVGVNQDTLIVTVCAPGCPPFIDKPFIIDLIAADDACPLPQLDTVRLVMNVEPPPNNDPILAPIPPTYTAGINEILTVDFTGTDQDLDQLFVQFGLSEDDGFNDLASLGFSLNVTRDDLGIIQGEIIWDTSCSTSDFSEIQTFATTLSVDDDDICRYVNESAQEIVFSVVLPPNSSPQISSDAPSEELNVVLGERLNFVIDVLDEDQDSVNLIIEGVGFDPADVGVDFNANQTFGLANGFFRWATSCESLDVLNKDFYTFLFITEDFDVCQEKNSDTLRIDVQIDIPENSAPFFPSYSSYELEVNQYFELDISAFDSDTGDSLTLRFFDGFRRPNSQTLNFEVKKGLSEVSSLLSWTPECDLLDLGETSKTFELIFQAFDDRCPVQASETVSIFFEVKETREFYDRFEPANAFSPNGDGINDFYSMSNLPNPNQNLPPNNCDDEFQSIIIVDRSGTVVFESDRRDFIWRGNNVESGTYFYSVNFAKTTYKGFVQVLK